MFIVEKFHGFNGPLIVSKKPWGTAIEETFLEAGRELGYETRDVNAENQTGFTIPDMTTYNGIRQSTAEAFLKPIASQRSNLEIITDSYVTKVMESIY